jgi:hypothetical protein
MFVLTVEARTATADALRQHVLKWPADMGTSATGWLGNTAGVSADGGFVLLMRFRSEEASLITSDLPEYGRWWQLCRQHLTTPPVFTPSTNITGILGGGSDQAAAVQITRGRAALGRLRDSLRQLESIAPDERSSLIGGIVAWHEDDRFTEALYFTSQDPARFQVQGTTPLGRFVAGHASSIEDASVVDLPDPWLTSPPIVASGSRGAR